MGLVWKAGCGRLKPREIEESLLNSLLIGGKAYNITNGGVVDAENDQSRHTVGSYVTEPAAVV